MAYHVFMTSTEDEVLTPTAYFARAVRRYRISKGWTQPELSTRCKKAGLNWDRSVVANVEARRRTSVTVHEVLTLATVFGIAPALLVFPVGTHDKIEVVSGHEVSPWTAVKWFVGEVRLGDGDIVASEPLRLFGEHDRVVESVGPAQWRAQITAAADDDRLLLRVHELETQLAELRGRIRSLGVNPPELPRNFEYMTLRGDSP